jgi:hypothetical protein
MYFFEHLETEKAALVTSYKKKIENSEQHLFKQIFSGQGFPFEIYNCLAV